MVGKLKNITRRDFINGAPVAIGVGLSPLALQACGASGSEAGYAPDLITKQTEPYPPARTGMRGSHVGSYEVAHDIAWGGKEWGRPEQQTDADYDLVVVGAGISGLSAAYFYRQRINSAARILVIDNHDDFGGHAKRNEFDVDGKRLIGYGGSQSIDTPSGYSSAAKGLLKDIGIKTKRFYKYYDQSFFSSRGMVERVYFDAEHYGEDKLTASLTPVFGERPEAQTIKDAIAAFPMSEETRASLEDFVLRPRDYLEAFSGDEKLAVMRKTSYESFAREYAGLTDEAIIFLRRKYLGLWAVGWDALSVMEGVRLGMPGLDALGLDSVADGPVGDEEPYIFHFPDGNASIARLLVRSMVPGAGAGETMEDVVTSQYNYAALDADGAEVRIRLSSTAVNVENTSDGKVDVTYVKDGQAFRVRSKNVVMGCYAHVTPYLCPEMPASQKEAISYPVKTPLVYTNVALRNWRAFDKAKAYRVYSPQAFFHSITLDFPVSMGRYNYASNPDQPIVATMHHAPISPGQGLNMKEQFRIGLGKLFQLSFEDFEERIIAQLTGALGPYGFDAEKDIAAITVNRWPHGYAYEYNELDDDWSYDGDNGPHIAGRAPIGRIVFSNSDHQALAYVNGAIDSADRAINEIMAMA